MSVSGREHLGANLVYLKRKIVIDFLYLHLDYIAMASVLLGYSRMADHKVDGWIYTGIGSVLLVIFGIFIAPNAMGVAIGNIPFVVIAIRGYLKWKKEA